MGDIALKIVETDGLEVPHSSDGVKVHVYDDKTYYVKRLMMNKKSFKTLLSFKLLKYIGVKVPNIMTYHHNIDFYNDIYLISEKCGAEAVAPLGKLPDDILLRKEIAKIIYIADLLGLGDIATDNII